MTLIRLLAALAFIVGAASASAQTPAPAAPATAVPKSTCVKPDHYPGRLASDNNKKQWERECAPGANA